MDDAITSLCSTQEVIELRRQLAELLQKAGFIIRKWCSNSPEVQEEVPEEDRDVGIVDLEEADLPCIKTLGVRRDAAKDVLGFSHTEVILDVVTKRTFLSVIAKLFDPLQLLAPFIIRAKMILQQSWISGLTLDEPFSPTLEEQVHTWARELPLIANFEVPKCYKNNTPVNTAIHTFTDASSLAYVRNVYIDGTITVRIVLAKARVTPLKAVSIPRLELMAALLGLTLALKVQELLDCSTL
jgi:hypothetical protein